MMTAMMTTATRIKRRQQVSYAQEQSSSVANVIANVTSAIVSAAVCSHTWQTRMRTNLGSLPGRTFRPRNRRSVEDMYKELGEVYIATPYPAVSGGTKDAYNFYHSQLQKQIECTFGILTHRWSILMRAIPMNVSIKKTVALVLALAKMHNY